MCRNKIYCEEMSVNRLAHARRIDTGATPQLPLLLRLDDADDLLEASFYSSQPVLHAVHALFDAVEAHILSLLKSLDPHQRRGADLRIDEEIAESADRCCGKAREHQGHQGELTPDAVDRGLQTIDRNGDLAECFEILYCHGIDNGDVPARPQEAIATNERSLVVSTFPPRTACRLPPASC